MALHSAPLQRPWRRSKVSKLNISNKNPDGKLNHSKHEVSSEISPQSLTYYNWTLLYGGNNADFQVASFASESTAASNSWEIFKAGVEATIERWVTVAVAV